MAKEYTPEMKYAIYVATLVIRSMIERGYHTLYFEDGTKVKPEEYFWDESQFPIEFINEEGKRIEVKKVALNEEESKTE